MMIIKKIIIFLFWGGLLILLFSCAGREKIRIGFQHKKINNWVCVYNENASLNNIKKFDLAILDADAHPDLAELKKSNTILIGYVSLGEVGEYRWYWKLIYDKPWVLDKNPNWGGHMIDVRSLEWHNFVIEKIIPKIMDQGFDGIFLDTIDNAEYLEKYYPKKNYPNAQESMVTLIRALRKNFPSIYIIVNRGFSILDKIGPVIDGVVAETIFSSFDFKTSRYRLLTLAEYSTNLKLLYDAKRKFNFAVFTLDYSNPKNKANIRKIIKKSRDHGFIPYISTINLDSIYSYTLELK